jgi:hypothetical protein
MTQLMLLCVSPRFLQCFQSKQFSMMRGDAFATTSEGCACFSVGILLWFCADEGRASSVMLRLDLATALKPLKLRLSLA